jgi:hypothetical protein
MERSAALGVDADNGPHAARVILSYKRRLDAVQVRRNGPLVVVCEEGDEPRMCVGALLSRAQGTRE